MGINNDSEIINDGAPDPDPSSSSSSSTGILSSTMMTTAPQSLVSNIIDDVNDENDDDDNDCVRVAVRIRPLLASEQGSDVCIQTLSAASLRIGGTGGPRFTFDQVLPPSTSQQQVYHDCVQPLVQSCLQGYNATMLAYGQTGSGKTYSVMGGSSSNGNNNTIEMQGMIPRALHTLFEQLTERTERGNGSDDSNSNVVVDYQVHIQFLELYGESIRDLLKPSVHVDDPNLFIRDGGPDDEPVVVGATATAVASAEAAWKCLHIGMLRRVTGATAMNESSSRSHAILSVHVEQNYRHGRQLRSKFHFVDLAGSERQKRTQATGKRLKEGIDINKGLLVLGNVISALAGGNDNHTSQQAKQTTAPTFVPYRDSKLTRLLKGSLGGNHKTLMLACVSPSSDNLDESLNCLRYANRAKNIQNKAVVNVDAQSQKVAALLQHIRILAGDLLRVWDGQPVVTSRAEAEAWAIGQQSLDTAAGASVAAAVAGTGDKPWRGSGEGAGGAKAVQWSNDTGRAAPSKRERELLADLNKVRTELRAMQIHHDQAEEQLYATKAEKELFQLQLSVLHDDGGPRRSTNNSLNSARDAAFLAKAGAYETKIGELRRALQNAETKAEKWRLWHGGGPDENNDGTNRMIEAARAAVEHDRQQLAELQGQVDSSPLVGEDRSFEGGDHNEERHEAATLDAMTSKYLGNDDNDDDVYFTAAAASDLITPTNGDQNVESPGDRGRQRVLQADLVELSRSIAAKEDLIDQLRLSQEKYASMREFYEERLQQMDAALGQKEAERETLKRELEQLQQEQKSSHAIEDKLREKEKHIDDLRRKQKELRDLTAVSSRNESEISRLQSDVQEMKRKKVDLQRQITDERKAHALELRQLHKSTVQKERELTKYKMMSSRHEAKAEKAVQVAKSRFEELGQLRTKYKDAEKKLRVLSVKRGVMAKTGLDPVLIGRRESKNAEDCTRADADALRDFFDQKVAEVVRKEAIVNKLAKEWEEHFELSAQRDDALNVSTDEPETLQTIEVQLQFQEEKIRKLAKRLGKPSESSMQSIPKDDSFLFDEQFAALCGDESDEAARSRAARILFGMIVRERRRVASLARTASALDERLQDAEKVADENEAALRSYKEEQSYEMATSKQYEQDRILSLMGMVRDDTVRDLSPSKSSETDRKLLVLANERVRVLEEQLRDTDDLKATLDACRTTISDLRSIQKSSDATQAELNATISETRSALRSVRQIVIEQGQMQGTTSNEILQVIESVLHPSTLPARRRSSSGTWSGKRKSSRFGVSPRLKKHAELMHTSDSGEEAVPAAWAEDIMADLALIAEGKIPPSLQGQANLAELTDGPPHVQVGSNELSPNRTGRSSLSGQASRQAISKEISATLDKIAAADAANGETQPVSPRNSRRPPQIDSSAELKEYKSVFERLVSPSHYTGTQKEKFHENQTKKDRSANEVADRMLDDLLRSDDDETGDIKPDKSAGSRPLASEYTQQDVFERLQRTTTQSYAVKHTGVFHSDHDGKSVSATTPAHDHSVSNDLASEYTQQNVFERLQKTTTEAYAKKTNKNRRNVH